MAVKTTMMMVAGIPGIGSVAGDKTLPPLVSRS
jgi:hypothetical protein